MECETYCNRCEALNASESRTCMCEAYGYPGGNSIAIRKNSKPYSTMHGQRGNCKRGRGGNWRPGDFACTKLKRAAFEEQEQKGARF